jgi:TP901 family phage tail tape measure protein
MALGTREMLLVIRARDEASRVLGRLAGNLSSLDKGAAAAAAAGLARGGALVSLGAGITAIGAAGLNFFNDTVDAAGEYETAARKALTQADGVKISLEDMKRIGRDVARDIPAAFDDMQESLYTIFSTIDTDMPGSEKLLRAFSKAAVAGQTDVQKATEGGLQAINAFGLGVEGVTRVNDVMFQLVRKGVGTYEQFVSSLGKAGPSAKRSGQDIETLAGMMAFLTRNGLSTSMAATSASRAFDLISNSKVDKRLQDFGVAVRDANGEFRPMGDIITDLGTKMADFTAPERAAALENLFKGSGNNVQARRFFDLAIPGFQQLNGLTGSMRNSAGAMNDAYKIMFDAPQSKVQLLTNKYDAMKTEIGDQLLPMKLKLLEALSSLLDWWEKLPGPVQKAIVIFGAVAAALMVLLGVVLMFAGAIIILNTALAILEIELAPILIPIGLIIAALIAIGVAVWAVIHYWDDIVAFTKKAWNAVSDWISKAVDNIVQWFHDLWMEIRALWTGITNWIGTAVDNIVSFFAALPAKVGHFFAELPNKAAEGLGYLIGTVVKFMVGMAVAAVAAGIDLLNWFIALPGNVYNAIVSLGITLAAWAVNTFTSLRDTAIRKGGELVQWFKDLPENIMTGLANFANNAGEWAINLLLSMKNGAETGGSNLIQWFKDLPSNLLKAAVNFATSFLQVGMDLIMGLKNGIVAGWDAFWGWVSGLFDSFIKGIKEGLGVSSPSSIFAEIGGWLLEGFLNGLKAAWTLVWDWVSGFGGRVLQGFINIGTWLLNAGRWLLDGFLNGAKAGFNFVVSWLQAAPGNIVRNLGNIGSLLVDAGSDLLHGLWNGISGAASWLKDKIMDWAGRLLPGWVKDILGIKSPSTVFADIGLSTMQGFAKGMDTGAVTAVKSAISAAQAVNNAFDTNIGLGTPGFSNYASGYISGGTGGAVATGAPTVRTAGVATVPITIYTNEINPLQHAAELGDIISNRVG